MGAAGSLFLLASIALLAVSAFLPWWYENESATQTTTFGAGTAQGTTSASYEFFPGPDYRVTCGGSSALGTVSSSECPIGTTVYSYSSGPTDVGTLYLGSALAIAFAVLLAIAGLVAFLTPDRRSPEGARPRWFPPVAVSIAIALTFGSVIGVVLLQPEDIGRDSAVPTDPAASTPSNSFWGTYSNRTALSPSETQESTSSWGAGSGWYTACGGGVLGALALLPTARASKSPPPRERGGRRIDPTGQGLRVDPPD